MSAARSSLTPLDRAFAQRILQSVGESGTPPERGVRHVNVGNEGYLEVLRTEYLEGLLPAGGSTFKLVQAYFGGGKTHFLLCLREQAWERKTPFCTFDSGLHSQKINVNEAPPA